VARPTGLEVAGEALDVGPATANSFSSVLFAPRHELSQIEGVGVAGLASVAGQERAERIALGIETAGRGPRSPSSAS